MRRYGLRDDQWDQIRSLLPGQPGWVGVTTADNRCSSRLIALGFRGPTFRNASVIGKNVHRRFSRWAKSSVWQRVFAHLAADADNEYAMIDSTIVRAHQHSVARSADPAAD